MNRWFSVLVAPLAVRLGALTASGIGGAMAVEPALSHRIEAWVVAGVALGVDLVLHYLRKREAD